jgi:hypothetical protein
MKVSLDEARTAKEEAKQLFAGLDFVVGIGITGTEGHYALKINLREDGHKDKVPPSIAGVPVRTEVVGEISKQSSQSSRDRYI